MQPDQPNQPIIQNPGQDDPLSPSPTPAQTPLSSAPATLPATTNTQTPNLQPIENSYPAYQSQSLTYDTVPVEPLAPAPQMPQTSYAESAASYVAPAESPAPIQQYDQNRQTNPPLTATQTQAAYPTTQPAVVQPATYTAPAELLQQPAPLAATQPPQVSPVFPAPPTPSRKKTLGLITGSVVGVLALLGIGGFLLFQSALNTTTVRDSDLISATSESTSFLRPKQWPQSTTNDAAYGVSLSSVSSELAMVAIAESKTTAYDFADLDETSRDQLRDATYASMSDIVVTNNVRNSDYCTKVSNITKVKSQKMSDTVLGLALIDAACTSSKGTFHIKMHVWLGSDDILRNTILVASPDIWQKNQTSFAKMIDSGDIVK